MAAPKKHHTYPKRYRHHLDKHAAQLLEVSSANGKPDDLLTINDVALWLSVGASWLANGRVQGYGPKYLSPSPSQIAYRRRDVLAWLKSRSKLVTTAIMTVALALVTTPAPTAPLMIAGPARVIDGGTVIVAGTTVRLKDVDAVELGTVRGEHARRVMVATVNGSPCRVT